MTLDDLINQFVEDLDFDTLIVWADTLRVEHDEKSWLDDEWTEKESELRDKVAEAMSNVGRNPKCQHTKSGT